MFSRIFYGIRQSASRTQRHPIEDCSSTTSEEFVRATTSMPMSIPTSLTAIFGLSPNKTDDFIQKDLISSSWS